MMNGIINIYKEKGFTSFDVVAKLRGILKTRKIGHTGTLDPDAEGVLPVCIGKATKICELLTDKTKEYEAVMLLGRTTDTQDVTGETLTQQEVRCSAKEVEKAVLSFVGDYMQVPPMYSALKVDGRKLCDLARAGVTVEQDACLLFQGNVYPHALPGCGGGARLRCVHGIAAPHESRRVRACGRHKAVRGGGVRDCTQVGCDGDRRTAASVPSGGGYRLSKI